MTDTHPSLPPRPWWPLLLLVIIAAAAILTYANSLTAPFVFDDAHNIVENPHVRMAELSLDGIIDAVTVGTRRPVASLTFALNYYFHGYDITGYHLVNIAIHILTGFLMFLVVRHTLGLMNLERRDMVAGLAALVWTVHPLHTQSVTYVVQRMAALATLFFLFALYLYIRGRLRQREGRPLGSLFFVLCGLSGILAVLSKQIAATLPFFILVYEWYFFQDLDRAWIKKQAKWIGSAVVVIGALAAIYLGASPIEKIMAMYKTQDFTLGQRLLTEPRVIFLYLSLILFPYPGRLNLDYDFPVSVSLIDPVTTLVSILGLIGLVAAAVVTAKRYRLVSFAVVWFLGNLAIESSFLGLALVFEHRTYLPSVLVIAALAWAAITYIRPRPLAIGFLCAVTLLWGFWTYQRNAIWADEVALWRDVTEKSPTLARPWSNLGMALQIAGNSEAALQAFQKAIALDPNHMEAHNNSGFILRELGRPKEAIKFFRRALEINPAYADAHYNLGLAFFDLKDMAQARTAFEQTLRVNPLYSKAHNNLGVILMQEGDHEAAVAAYQRALKTDPRFAQAYNNLGIIAYQQGNPDQAASFFKKALTADPAYAGAANNLARVRQTIEKHGPAITELKQMLHKTPNDVDLSCRLAQVYQAAGMRYGAISQYQKALALQPGHGPSLNALGVLYAAMGQPAKAVECFRKLSALMPGNATIYYNLACLYARQNQVEPAVENLKKALDAGYDNREQIRADKDLAPIRDTEFYKTRIDSQEPGK
ncbi:tetratricopeptide repeat protein [Desulfosudis oleivorans]|uniref:Tetratricopeptide TPR_2 repeat protein n=1 Tax=Desulfosudis oleivorans (strain DSM 6200 / JCM 39069 / Hxd3) TaxID=96561 RepID=A8ZVN4_DESOH|nr:tetratricopeptide repeat protein [Desulfosudis oleivorans]ABW68221.1 Tetratricopeptide TPR_2 repeat protein [Desulfosudis oleivorans Hxd3]